jgi:hypothetical protein
MSLRAVEHSFSGATTPIGSYDSTKTNLGSLMVQKSGINPEDNFAGPLPVAVARPMEESTGVAMMYPHVLNISPTIDWVFLTENLATATAARRIFLYEYNKQFATYNWKGFITATLPSTANANTTRGFRALRYLHSTGTVSVGAPVAVYTSAFTASLAVNGTVTGIGTTFLISHVGMMIGFGSKIPAEINCWYPIISFTSATVITVSGASNVIAASANYVIATCTVTNTNNVFTTERIAAGTAGTGVAGGLGPRIGFGSTDPTQITQWFQIGSITSDTVLNITTSPGVIAAGTPYVIEELRFVLAVSQATAPTNGGLFLLKGACYTDFTTGGGATGNTFPAISSAITNQRGVYWLADASTITNTAPNGCAIEPEIDKLNHWAYVLDGTATSSAKIFKYNLRAADTTVAGKMTLSTVTPNVVVTGAQAVTGTIPNLACNNGIIATFLHGPGANNPYFYFVTTTRLYCVAVSAITSGSTTFIVATNPRQEMPPGGVTTFPLTGNMANIQNIDTIDRLIITTSGGAGAAYRNYVTRYPVGDNNYNVQFDHIFGIDDKQQDMSYLSSQGAIHFNTGSQLLSCDANNGIVHICKNNTTIQLNQMYALPFGAHWTYAYTTSPANHQRIITPSINTTGCVKFDQVLVLDDDYIGAGELRLSPEPYRVYYRTTNIITDATSSWTLLGVDGDLSSVASANAIQFMFEFYTIGNICIPSKLLKVVVTYEDGMTDSHYQLSATLSNITAKTFTWRFSQSFGGTVPTLEILLFNAATGVSLPGDTTLTTSNGTWNKSIDGGNNWIPYNTNDKINDNTYIRYTSTSGSIDGITVRAVLNHY